MRYEYQMVQIPTDWQTQQASKDKDSYVANFVQQIVNKYAAEGWEFYRIDSMTTTEKPGCFSGNNKDIYRNIGIITFRKEIVS